MFGTNNFLKYFITTFFTLILFMNIVYAFNLTNSLGIPVVFQNDGSDYSQYYFSVTNIIDSFQKFFRENKMIKLGQDMMKGVFNAMNTLRIENLLGYQTSWSVNGADFTNVLNFFSALFNILVNVPYTIMVVIYFLLFLIYILIIIFAFISYIFYLINGAFRTILNPTDFPTLEDIEEGGWFSTILQSQFILH